MANEARPDTLDLAAADAAAEKMLRTGNDVTLTGVDPSRENALDEAFAAVAPPTETEVEFGKENGGVERPIPGAPAKEAKPEPAPEPAPEPKAEPKTAKAKEEPAPAPERKGLLDDVLEEPAAPKKDEPEKAYDDIKLRSDASPKTQETFNAQRARAIERENAALAKAQAAEASAEALKKEVEELKQKSSALPDNIAAELKEHREYRALHDVASRPEFKEKFDAKIESNYGAIYDLLKQEGWDDAKVKQLKAMPEAQRIDFIEKKLGPLFTEGQRRFVEAKIYDNVNIAGEKTKALDAARTEAEKILAEQRELPAKQRAQKDTEFANVLRPKLQKLAFVYPKEIPTTATAPQKAEIDAHNKFALEYQEDVRRAIADESPEIRAEVILAVPLARYLKRENVALKARAEAAEAKLAAISKAGGTGRLGQSSAAPAPGANPPRPAAADSGDNIDQLFAAASGNSVR